MRSSGLECFEGECREGTALLARESEGCPLGKELLRVGGRDMPLRGTSCGLSSTPHKAENLNQRKRMGGHAT